MTQVIILGWDALDSALIERYDLGPLFGQYHTTIETHVNPEINEPHTRELWPSLITGLHPDEHGIHAVTDDEGVEWQNPYLNTLSTIANGIVPQPVLDAIGKRLRERGAALDQKRPRYYHQQNIETVFAQSGAKALSIPNYETGYDTQHGLDATRDDVWAELLVDRDGVEGFEPDIEPAGIYDVLGREVGQRLGHTLTAMQQGYSLIWVWFGLLDTVGHMAPAVEMPIQEDWYRVAGQITATIRAAVSDETRVLCLSDHGLQDGEHTHYATLTASHSEPVEQINSIFDVAPYLMDMDFSRNPATHGVSGMVTVKSQLSNLGYVE